MKRIIIFIFVLSLCGLTMAQAPKDSVLKSESLAMHVNKMSANRQNQILNSCSFSTSRGLGESVAATTIGAVVDVALTEFVKLVTLKDRQEKEWRSMIEKESCYKGEIKCRTDLNDFYSNISRRGVMDPVGFAFDGVTICDTINGKEVLRMVCSVDMSDSLKIQNMWKYGVFELVLDTFIFCPYDAHLPNLEANGIRDTSKSKRNNCFSFDEREVFNLAIKMDLTSSWINQAAMVMRDVKLGEFNVMVSMNKEKMQGKRVFEYVRGRDHDNIEISGHSFIVPRSYIMSADSEGVDLWGTGAFKISAQLTETCGFNFNADKCEKANHWRTDYYRICKMQKSSLDRFTDYMISLFSQNTGVVIKKTVTKAAGGLVDDKLGISSQMP